VVIDESAAPLPILPIVPKGRFGAVHIHPLELARQMTLIDQELWAAIEPWEFHKQVLLALCQHCQES